MMIARLLRPFGLPCLVLMLAVHPNMPRAAGLEIVGSLLSPGEIVPGTDGVVTTGPPEALVGDGNLTDLFNAAADVWESIILDDHTVTINYGWTDQLDFFGFETMVSQQSEAPYRITESSIQIGSLADESFPFYMDPTPLDHSEYTTFHVSHRDLSAGKVNTERIFRGATGLAANSADLFSTLVHEIGHALGLDPANTAYTNEANDDVIDVDAPLPFAGSQIASRRSHLSVNSTLMADAPGNSIGQRRYPSEVDILAIAQVSQFTDINLEPVEFPEPYRGPGAFVDVLKDIPKDELRWPFTKTLVGPDGDLYVAMRPGGTDEIRRYNSETLELIDTFATRDDAYWNVLGGGITDLHTIAFGPDGNLYIAGIAEDGTDGILRYSGTTGDFTDVVAADIGRVPPAFAFGPDGDLYVVDGVLNQVRNVVRYDPATGERKGDAVRVPAVNRHVKSMDLVFRPDGEWFIRGEQRTRRGWRPVLRRSNGEVFIDDLNEGVFRLMRDEPTETGVIEFGPDGNLYAASSTDFSTSLRVFDGDSGDYLGEFIDDNTGGLGGAHSLAFSTDGRLFISYGDINGVDVIIFNGPTVPEPQSCVLLFAGIVPLILQWRRRSLR